MKKLRLSIICLSLVISMLLVSCANKITGASDRMPNPSKQSNVETEAPLDEKNTGVYNISTDFTKKRISTNVTIEEVEELMILAREVYSKYDTVIVDEYTTYKPIDIPELTVEKADKLDIKDQQIMDFEKSLAEMQYIFITMLSRYLPENNVYIVENSNFPYPDYYFLNLEEKGYKNAKEAFEKTLENGTPSFDKIADCVYVLKGVISFYDAETDESIQIFLTPNEKAITSFINDRRISKDKDPDYYIKLHGLDK
ncbi:MAG: hypothetical protein J6L96_04395 [Clostridia bacterium]|nr:hypothetical protein [Clostridia bacterium]